MRTTLLATGLVLPLVLGALGSSPFSGGGGATSGVDLTSNQTIAGTKTFSSAPVSANGFRIDSLRAVTAFSSGTLVSSSGSGFVQLRDGSSGNAFLAVDINTGSLYSSLKVNATDLGVSKPTCNSTNRGRVWRVEGAGGVADTFEWCKKDAADAYAWTAL